MMKVNTATTEASLDLDELPHAHLVEEIERLREENLKLRQYLNDPKRLATRVIWLRNHAPAPALDGWA
ncbi:MAG: hypothetical protein M3024_14310 [Candidatus Dormibacteraeota bacterium]|nr:hypothetical protein [Candidatus Dormibacteraeota bacterium]